MLLKLVSRRFDSVSSSESILINRADDENFSFGDIAVGLLTTWKKAKYDNTVVLMRFNSSFDSALLMDSACSVCWDSHQVQLRVRT